MSCSVKLSMKNVVQTRGQIDGGIPESVSDFIRTSPDQKLLVA